MQRQSALGGEANSIGLTIVECSELAREEQSSSNAMCAARGQLEREGRNTPPEKKRKGGERKQRTRRRRQKRRRNRRRRRLKKRTSSRCEEEPAVKTFECNGCGKSISEADIGSDQDGLVSDEERARRYYEFQMRQRSSRPSAWPQISFMNQWRAERSATYQATFVDDGVEESHEDESPSRESGYLPGEEEEIRNGKGRRIEVVSDLR